MDEEAGFLVALAAAPNDLTTHLVYADWLDEHDDPAGSCLRAWVELIQTPYVDATYRDLLAALERFRAALDIADPQWVELVGEARDWIDAAVAERAVRLHLRVRHGRKSDRQWVGRPTRATLAVWRVAYWRCDPETVKGNSWHALRHRVDVQVDRVTGVVHEPPTRQPHTVTQPPQAS